MFCPVEDKNTESNEGNEGLACGFQKEAETLRAICVTFWIKNLIKWTLGFTGATDATWLELRNSLWCE